MSSLRAHLSHLLVLLTAISTLAVVPATAQELPPGGTFSDDNGNVHEGYIEAIAAAGITAGCDAEGTMYCPDDPVTRAQMASFLARALDLPDTSVDYFGDDEGSPHEDNINRIAEAGVTLGVEEGVFEPNGWVPRDQMASFLARALQLQSSGIDHFDDDDGNVHEDNINIIAEAGISLGCDDEGLEYCPDNQVSRAQMASFLGRALELEEIVPPPLEIPDGPLTDDQARALFALYFAPDDVEDAIRIAECESNLDPDAWNPAGYGGLFQHAASAWDARAAAVGFAGASIFDAEANTAAAAALKGDGPWSPHWPYCSTLLG